MTNRMSSQGRWSLEWEVTKNTWAIVKNASRILGIITDKNVNLMCNIIVPPSRIGNNSSLMKSQS